eukprot:CAMPEP_0115045976 /NCGR_PEP_ID=MMETSP0216-20121206/48487_1 /TAXON_ID=223996 /ORGANISM="Protocruzia adherens, Strain Boccale" /LENGTH=110 /DNA_ID=CAMNT_0002428995 /DNA_START=54 /DNA_END=383 /DNA_ORIENTATION=+
MSSSQEEESPSSGVSNTKISKSLLKNSKNFPQNQVIKFEWEDRWLTGEEYAHMLRNAENYCSELKLQQMLAKSHPNSIYTDPKNGEIYFVEGNSVGSEFGFPRVDIKKKY